MNDAHDRQFEEINKFIFVKEYERAFDLLEDLLSKKDARENMLYHLRRIELGLKIRDKDWFITEYKERLEQKQLSDECVSICLALTRMFGDMASGEDSVKAFKDILSQFGDSPGAYFGLAFSLEAMGNYDRAMFNYKRSIEKDPKWYPSYFGLSQVFYQQQDQENGDHFFYLFEKFAPFNLYGNFETHKRLSEDFMNRELYREAECAIKLLSEWWVDNKGDCPFEVEIYETLMLLDIAKSQNHPEKIQALVEKLDALNEENLAVNFEDIDLASSEAMYFVARSYEDFSDHEMAKKYYRAILTKPDQNLKIIEKMSQHLLSEGKAEAAIALFSEAYKNHPENANVRFCLLVSRLKMRQIPINEYLEKKERVKLIWQQSGRASEVLPTLIELIQLFPEDADVHGNLAEMFLGSGNLKNAHFHFEEMYRLDGENKFTKLKYAKFLADHKQSQGLEPILSGISFDPSFHPEEYCDLLWLRACHVADRGQLEEALDLLRSCSTLDPWNISFLASEVIWKTKLRFHGQDCVIDEILINMKDHQEESGDWEDFFERTEFYLKEHEYDIAYSRYKLYYLYTGGSGKSFRSLLEAASQYDANKGRNDLIRLLNTNFDSPGLYLGLGQLSKELWQLEAAEMWFDQLLGLPGISPYLKSMVYIELADCYIWSNKNIQKGLEYTKMIEEDEPSTLGLRQMTIQAHAYLRLGQINQAKIVLEKIPEKEKGFEARYLTGLLHYRNGMTKQARAIWKPLLTFKSSDLKTHHIKQELLRFYFNGETYLKAH